MAPYPNAGTRADASVFISLVIAAKPGQAPDFYEPRNPPLRENPRLRVSPAVTPTAMTTATTTATQPATEAEALGPHARRYTLVVTDATDDDVHQALAMLPPQAGYHLTATEQTVDGR